MGHYRIAELTTREVRIHRSTNPCRGLKTPRRKGGKEIAVMTVEQFKVVHMCIPSEAGKVMTRLTVATGMRFGEITELMVTGLDYDTGVLDICKANTEPGAEESSNGSRYQVNDWTMKGAVRQARSTVWPGGRLAGAHRIARL